MPEQTTIQRYSRTALTDPDYLPMPRQTMAMDPARFALWIMGMVARFTFDRSTDLLPSALDRSAAMLATLALSYDGPDAPDEFVPRPEWELAPLAPEPTIGEVRDGNSTDPAPEVFLQTVKHPANQLGEVKTYRQRWHMYVIGETDDGSYGSISHAGALAMADLWFRANPDGNSYKLDGIEDQTYGATVNAGEGLTSPCAVGSSYKSNGELDGSQPVIANDRASYSRWVEGIEPTPAKRYRKDGTLIVPTPKPTMTSADGTDYYLVGKRPNIGQAWMAHYVATYPQTGYIALCRGAMVKREEWHTTYRRGRFIGHGEYIAPKQPRAAKVAANKQAKAPIETTATYAPELFRDLSLLVRLEQSTIAEARNPRPEALDATKPKVRPRSLVVGSMRFTVKAGSQGRLNVEQAELLDVDGKQRIGQRVSSSVTSPDYARAWIANKLH